MVSLIPNAPNCRRRRRGCRRSDGRCLESRAAGEPLGRPLDVHVLEPCVGESLAQDVRVGDLELERRRIVREVRGHRRHGRLALEGRLAGQRVAQGRTQRPHVARLSGQLPAGDLGIQKGFQRLFKLRAKPNPKQMEKLARPWAGHRTLACMYLWRLLDDR